MSPAAIPQASLHDTSEQVAADLGKAGSIALPLMLILLVLAFGSGP